MKKIEGEVIGPDGEIVDLSSVRDPQAVLDLVAGEVERVTGILVQLPKIDPDTREGAALSANLEYLRTAIERTSSHAQVIEMLHRRSIDSVLKDYDGKIKRPEARRGTVFPGKIINGMAAYLLQETGKNLRETTTVGEVLKEFTNRSGIFEITDEELDQLQGMGDGARQFLYAALQDIEVIDEQRRVLTSRSA